MEKSTTMLCCLRHVCPTEGLLLLDVWSVAQYKYSGSAFLNMHAVCKIPSQSLKAKCCLVTGRRIESNRVDVRIPLWEHEDFPEGTWARNF